MKLNGNHKVQFLTWSGLTEVVDAHFHEGKAMDVLIPIGADLKAGKRTELQIDGLSATVLVESCFNERCEIVIL